MLFSNFHKPFHLYCASDVALMVSQISKQQKFTAMKPTHEGKEEKPCSDIFDTA